MRNVLAAITVLAAVACTGAATNKPNFLFLLSDDLGICNLPTIYGQKMGIKPESYGPDLKTPFLDAFAKQSLVFDNAFSAPVCAPTRASIVTGRTNGKTSLRQNDGSTCPLRADEPSIPSVLDKAGYDSALFGKWGLGNLNTTGYPTAKSFNTFYGVSGAPAHCVCAVLSPRRLANLCTYAIHVSLGKRFILTCVIPSLCSTRRRSSAMIGTRPSSTSRTAPSPSQGTRMLAGCTHRTFL